MELFRPSQRILEEICLDEERSNVQYTIFPPSEADINPFFEGLLEQIRAFYQLQELIDAGKTRGMRKVMIKDSRVLLLASEALLNAQWHGAKNERPITFGLFLGLQGLCYGFQDGGDYFKRPEIKAQFEGKKPITEFSAPVFDGKGQRQSGCHAGVNGCIYECDIIEVDTNAGVLYCVLRKDSIITLS